MDAIFIGIIRSEHPLKLKRKLIANIANSSKIVVSQDVLKSILQHCYNILVGSECHPDSAVQLQHEVMARDVFSCWVRDNVMASVSFLSEASERARSLPVVTQIFKLKHFEIVSSALKSVGIRDLDSNSLQKPVMDYLVSAFLAEEDIEVASNIAILLTEYSRLILCCYIDEKIILQSLVTKTIILVSNAEIVGSRDNDPELNSMNVRRFTHALTSYFERCVALLPSLKEFGMKMIIDIISKPDKSPSIALASFLEHLDKGSANMIFVMIVNENSISNERIELALCRMFDWLAWPSVTYLDSWIISLIKCLVVAKKYDIVISVVEAKLMQVIKSVYFKGCRPTAISLLTYMLISYQHSPDLFCQACPPIKDLIKVLRIENSTSSGHALQVVVELTFTLMYHFPGFPEVYGPIVESLQGFTRPTEQQMKQWLEQSLYAQKQGFSPPVIRISTPKSATGKTGLINLGNTCYMNSVIQSLFMLSRFREQILGASYSSVTQPVSFQLQRLFAFLTGSQRPSISPLAFYRCSRPPWFREYAQQDCSEFLKYLLDKLEQESNSSLSPETCSESDSSVNSPQGRKRPHDLFQGELEVMVECLHCHAFSCRTEIFNDLPLSFPDISGSVAKNEVLTLKGGNVSDSNRPTIQTGLAAATQEQEAPSLIESSPQPMETDLSHAHLPASQTHMPAERRLVSDLLQSYFSPEVMQDTNQYYCDFCGALQDARKTMHVVRPPRYLTLTLKRFTYDVETHMRGKVLQDLHYALALDVAYSPRSSLSGTEKSCDDANCDEADCCLSLSPKLARKRSHSSSENRKLLCPDSESMTLSAPYSLVAVIVHSGMSSESGHYYCFGRDRGLGHNLVTECAGASKDSSVSGNYRWFLFNDSRVTSSTEEAFSSLSRNFPRDTPYVLVYQQTDLDDHVVMGDLPGHLTACVRSDNDAFIQEQQREYYGELRRQNHSHWKKDDDRDKPGGDGGSGYGGSCAGSMSGNSINGGSRFIC